MSRIGKKPIPIPAGVTVAVEPEVVHVTGPRGGLSERKNRDIDVRQDGDELLVVRPPTAPSTAPCTAHALADRQHGRGRHRGFTKTLEIQGVGYRAQLKGSDLELALGYSHPVPIKAPQGIEFEVPQPTAIVIKGNDKQQVGQIAAVIRKQRPPEPYKGKGIRYEGEYVARKVGKRA
jgi:large subunit ribosomal protein L6